MGQFSALNRFLNQLRTVLGFIGDGLRTFFRFLKTLWQRLVTWLRLHVPLVEALIQRHLNNPATIFVDTAIAVLALYVALGLTGAVLVYGKKSESRFTETLAVLYPLPAVKVDSTFIWSHHFLQRLRFLTTFNQQAPAEVTSRPPTDKDLREKIMEGLIENQVIILEAKSMNVRVSEDELNAAYNQQKQQTDNFEQKIQQLYGMNPTDFREVLAEQILKEKVKGAVLTRIKVRHILTTSLDAANQAKKALNDGGNFADVAKEFSQDKQTKDTGGELGYWTKGDLASQISQTFEDAAFSLPVNQVSDPVQTPFGYHIIQVTDRADHSFESYNDWYASALKKHKIRRFLSI